MRPISSPPMPEARGLQPRARRVPCFGSVWDHNSPERAQLGVPVDPVASQAFFSKGNLRRQPERTRLAKGDLVYGHSVS